VSATSKILPSSLRIEQRREFKVTQELLRHSSLRSTLNVYTQAISPANHAAQAAVLALVFSSETNPWLPDKRRYKNVAGRPDVKTAL